MSDAAMDTVTWSIILLCTVLLACYIEFIATNRRGWATATVAIIVTLGILGMALLISMTT